MDFPALYQAVRQPLKRWWRCTGWWWLILPALAFAYDIIAAFYLSGSQSNVFSVVGGAYGHQASLGLKVLAWLAEMADLLPWAAMLALWLLAAQQVNAAFNAIFCEANAPRDDRGFKFKFIAGMRQGLIPVAVVLSYAILAPLIAKLGRLASHGKPLDISAGDLLQAFNAGLDDGLYLVAAALWLIALAVVTFKQPVLVWLIVIPLLILPRVISLTTNLVNNVEVYGLTDRLEFTGAFLMGSGYFFYAGLLAMIALVWGFRSQRWGASWVAYGVILLASGLKSTLVLFMSKLTTEQSVNPVVTAIFKLETLPDIIGFTPVKLSVLVFQGQLGSVLLFRPHGNMTLPPGSIVPAELGYIVVNIIFLVLLYWFMRNVLLRPGHSRGTDQA